MFVYPNIAKNEITQVIFKKKAAIINDFILAININFLETKPTNLVDI